MALIDDFKARFPDIATAAADKYVPLIEPVYRDYYDRPYQSPNEEAILHLIAHLVIVESQGVDPDPAQREQSKSADGVSVSFAARSEAAGGGLLHDMFSTTRYGQRFLMLTMHKRGGVAV